MKASLKTVRESKFVSLKKVPTGVQGLDDMLGGGLPLGRCILICGGPGSGKTIFGVQFLYNGAINYGETGLYVSLDENPSHLKENMSSIGWDIQGLEKEGKLVIVDASPIRTLRGEVKIGKINIGKRDFSMLSLIEIIKTRAQEIQAKRIVIDPITSLILQYPDVSERRNALLDLMEAIMNMGITTLMTTELRATSLERQIRAEEFLLQGVLLLHTFTEGGKITRALRIEKMRGIAHDQQLRPYEINEKGIVVFPRQSVLVNI